MRLDTIKFLLVTKVLIHEALPSPLANLASRMPAYKTITLLL
jgi:hypothetical protein